MIVFFVILSLFVLLTIGTPVGFAMAIAGGAEPLPDRRPRHGVGNYSDFATLGGRIL